MAGGITWCSIKKPETFKDLLDFLAKVETGADLRHDVYERMVNKMEPFVGGAEKKKFHRLDFVGDEFVTDGYVKDLFDGVKDLRQHLLADPDDYGAYNNMCLVVGHTHCYADTTATALEALPRLYSSLYFLYFNGAYEMKAVKGGEWKDDYLDDENTTLHKWLKDQLDVENPQLVKGGFGNVELAHHTGDEVATKVRRLLHTTYPTALQNLLTGSLFATEEWNDSLLSHALMFTHDFCDYINNHMKYFQESAALTGACDRIKQTLHPFTKNGLGFQYAVCKYNNDMYSGRITARTFSDYLMWLEKNINKINYAVRDMKEDCVNWTAENISNGTTAGPFKYGFIFKDENWEKNVKGSLPGMLYKLSDEQDGSLLELWKELLKFIEKREFGVMGKLGSTSSGGSGGSLGSGGSMGSVGDLEVHHDEEVIKPQVAFGTWTQAEPAATTAQPQVPPVTPVQPAAPAAGGNLTGQHAKAEKESLASEISIMPIFVMLLFFASKIF